MSSAISSALSSYDDSSQVNSKIVTALLDFYNRAETDQAIADAASSSVDLSAYYTSAQTDSLFYPHTELDSLLTATLTQYWTSGRTQTEIDDALAGSGFLDLTAGDARYLVRAPGAESGQIFNNQEELAEPGDLAGRECKVRCELRQVWVMSNQCGLLLEVTDLQLKDYEAAGPVCPF